MSLARRGSYGRWVTFEPSSPRPSGLVASARPPSATPSPVQPRSVTTGRRQWLQLTAAAVVIAGTSSLAMLAGLFWWADAAAVVQPDSPAAELRGPDGPQQPLPAEELDVVITRVGD